MAIKLTEYLEMTLGEVLLELEGYVKLGTADGGAFLYAESVEGLTAKIDELDKKYTIEHKERIKKYEASIKDTVENFDATPNEYVKKEFKKANGKRCGTLIGYLTFLDTRFTALRARIDKLQVMKKESYIPLRDRLIVDARLSIDEPDCTILVIEGREEGSCWTINEYRYGVKEPEDDEEVGDIS